VAADSTARRRGLLGRGGLDDGTALVLAPCSAIHTWFMRFPIDVVFVTRAGEVVAVRSGVRPWRIAVSPGAFAAIEVRAGAAARGGIRPGDHLLLEDAAA
jgi:uncharacterized membrane protein (UPF0127 family)